MYFLISYSPLQFFKDVGFEVLVSISIIRINIHNYTSDPLIIYQHFPRTKESYSVSWILGLYITWFTTLLSGFTTYIVFHVFGEVMLDIQYI